MLTHLSIQNFTLISQLDLEFKSGMTVLTGETGAGKSILIDALALALGDRADSSVVQQNQERCIVSVSFDIQKLPAAQQWLSEHELANNEECLLRRIIGSDGRSRGFINGQPVPLQSLRELGNFLLSIHAQHEHQALLKSDKQRQMLDAFAGHLPLLKKAQEFYASWRKAQDELSTLQKKNEQRDARLELLKYQVQELDKLALQENELTQLDQEQRQLANADSLLKSIQTILALLTHQEDNNILLSLSKAQSGLISLTAIDNKLHNIEELLRNAIIQIKEANSELEHYFEHIELNPERLQWVEQRLSHIHEIARKHHIAPENLPNLHQQLQVELKQIENSDNRLKQLENEIEKFAKEYQTVAKKLSLSRQEAANRLTNAVENSIQQLGMQRARFAVQFEPNPPGQFISYGLERLEFCVSINPGQALQSLSKVASGGELSRISLAIHVLTAQTDVTPTLIFDEVDVGIGGGTAEIVGRLLRKLGDSAQILCVTHLPQVAALGHHHLQVGKIMQQNSTQSEIHVLDEDGKVQEIARMLGGIKITEQTIAHAREMLENVGEI